MALSVTFSRILYPVGKDIGSKTTSYSTENGGNETSAVFVLVLITTSLVLAACRSLGRFSSNKATDNGAQKTGTNTRCRVGEVFIDYIARAGDGAGRAISGATPVVIVFIVRGWT
ncbi:hypothetical protein HG530_000899 [Fusarium avenaceum]|nr:hypothetical protein HG530_000899 [Fusarium avenaceum]